MQYCDSVFFCIRCVRLSERKLVLDGKVMMEMEFSVSNFDGSFSVNDRS